MEKGVSREENSGHDASFAALLRQLRNKAGLTQEELALRAGLTPNAVSALERAVRKRPYPHTVRSIADALELSDEQRSSLLAAVPKRNAALRKPSPVPGQPVTGLPSFPTPLVGREREMKEVTRLLSGDSGVRMLTLTGTGGVGKTRLAAAAAHAALDGDRFPDGVAFVALAPLGDAALVVPAIARSLGLREAERRDASDVLREHLHERRTLLVLDNFEHLLGASAEVAGLIEASPGLVVLATSRAPLRVRGEQEYPVPPLALPPSAHGPTEAEVLATSSGRLFAERARAASPSFALSARNAPSVAAICWRLAGLPLALELAAAKVRFLDPASLLSRLDQALSTSWARDLPERQRTMRATLDWSHELLSGPERGLFRRLSMFVGGFTLEAAEAVTEAVTGPGEVLGLLGALVEQSLVVMRPPPEDGEARYGMLEPVRQYALEKLLESGEAGTAGRGHASFYVALADRARPGLQGPHQAEWMDRLAREHANVRASVSWLLGRGGAAEVARIGWGIHEFWFRRGYMSEGLVWMERALGEGDAPPDLWRARALYVIAILSFLRGEPEQAAAAVAECVAAGRASGDPETLAYALGMQGLATVGGGELDAGEAALSEALTLFREAGDPHGVASGLYGLANLALARKDIQGAKRLLAEGEALSRRAMDWAMLANFLGTQAISARLESDDARTARLLQESAGIAGALRDGYNVAFCATGLAGVATRAGDAERAARLFGVADALSEETGAGISWSVLRGLNERDLEITREMLDLEVFEKAWMEGRAMPLEEAAAYALSEPGVPEKP